MSITQDDFKKIWASTSSVSEYTFSDSDYQDGWEFVGNLPPTRAMWDTLQRRNDQKMKFLQDNGSMCFDSVADMVSTDLDEGQTVFTKGYHSVNDGGSAIYTIRAKDVADVEDGGSIIFLDNENVAELIVDDEVNINQFGGKGDGTTDDNTAIVNAVAYASAKNKRLVFLNGYTYYSSQGIVIANPPTEIRMDGALKYDGSGTALTIGTNTATLMWGKIKINVVGTKTANSNGVKLINLNTCEIHIDVVDGFGNVGVEFYGYNAGFGYNNCYITEILSCPVCLKLNSAGNRGWVNDNRFFGGRLTSRDSDVFETTAIGILIASEREYYNNNNIFYSPSLEIAYPLVIEYGASNRFYNCRTEGCTEAMTIDSSNSGNVNNIMEAYLGSFTNNNLQKYLHGNLCRYIGFDGGSNIEFPILVYDSGNIEDKIAANASHTSVGGLIISRNGNFYSKYDKNYIDISDGMLRLVFGIAVGMMIETLTNNAFKIYVDSTDMLMRPTVKMYDADGNVITGNENAPVYNNLYKMTYSSSDSAYSIGADANVNGFRIELPSNCVKAYIGVYKNGAKVKRFALRSFGVCKLFTLDNFDYPMLSSIPTSTGKKGQFVKNETPSAGAVGWVYDGANWIAVG